MRRHEPNIVKSKIDLAKPPPLTDTFWRSAVRNPFRAVMEMRMNGEMIESMAGQVAAELARRGVSS